MQINPEASAIGVPPEIRPLVIGQFLDALFGNYEWQDGEGLCLRGLGEKATGAEGQFREAVWVRGVNDDLHANDDMDGDSTRHAARWCDHGHGAFIVPAVCRVGAPGTGAKDADVLAYTCLCLDLDDPEHAESTLNMVEGAIGPASIVVESSPGKRHGYWVFNEPETDVKRVAAARHMLALKCGGDVSFQRLPQVIRIPGAIHNKKGVKSQVELLHCDPDCVHSFDFLDERIREMFPLPRRNASADAELAKLGAPVGGGLSFHPSQSGIGTEGGAGSLTRDITEGGNDVESRWSVFNQVAGSHIRAARVGGITLDEAKNFTAGWVASHMIPPWPAQRFEAEWNGLLNKDTHNHGALPGAPTPEPESDDGAEPSVFNRSGLQVDQDQGDAPSLLYWNAGERFSASVTPKRKWLVKGLVRAGAAHVMAAEGGVGKTFALLELALKIAAPRPGDTWMGQPMDPDHIGGRAIVITTEDDKDEIHIRLNALDPDGSRREQARAAGKLIIAPLMDSGGAFPLVEIGHGGIAKASPSWSKILNDIAKLHDPDGGNAVQFVAIDTLAATLHGEENASVIVQQYVTALNLVQHKKVAPGCASMVTHHVRKQGTKDTAIQTAADMRNAIRGSNALLGAVRMAIGIWQHPSWADTLLSLGQPVKPNTLFQIAVVKGNNDEVLDGERTLLRTKAGGLADVTAAVRDASGLPEKEAWMEWSVRQAVAQFRPFTKSQAGEEVREKLPEVLQRMGRDAIIRLADSMCLSGLLTKCKTTPNGKMAYLDEPGGDLAKADLTGWKAAQGALTLDTQGWFFHRQSCRVERLPINP